MQKMVELKLPNKETVWLDPSTIKLMKNDQGEGLTRLYTGIGSSYLLVEEDMGSLVLKFGWTKPIEERF